MICAFSRRLKLVVTFELSDKGKIERCPVCSMAVVRWCYSALATRTCIFPLRSYSSRNCFHLYSDVCGSPARYFSSRRYLYTTNVSNWVFVKCCTVDCDVIILLCP